MEEVHETCHSHSLPRTSIAQIMEEEKSQGPLSRCGHYGPHCDTGRSRSQLWGHMLQRTLKRTTERVAMVRLVLSFVTLASCRYCLPVPFPITKQPCRLCWHLAWDSTTSPSVSGERSTSRGQFNPTKGQDRHFLSLLPQTAEIV